MQKQTIPHYQEGSTPTFHKKNVGQKSFSTVSGHGHGCERPVELWVWQVMLWDLPISHVVSKWAECALAHLEFGSPIYPILGGQIMKT
jgi:hypothetical protein